MSYAELFPALLAKNHVQTRSPPPVPKDLPYWYKADQFCAYHQRAPGHSIEKCFGLKSDVQRLIKSGILSFKDVNPNVQVNPLPQHDSSSVNMVYGCPGSFWIYDVRLVGENLVKKHTRYSKNGFVPPHNYASCRVCSGNSQGCLTVVTDLQDQMDQGYIVDYRARDYNQVNMVNSDNKVNVIVPQFNNFEPIHITYDSRKTFVTPLVINLSGLVRYQFYKVVPYKYDATMTENGNDVPLPSIVNIVDVSRVTRSERIFAKRIEDVAEGKQAHVEILFEPVDQSDKMNPKSDDDEVLKLIKKSEYNMVEQLLHTPSKISVLSLLMNYEAHREALQKVLKQAYVDHDVTVRRFDGIVANITACNNLSFSNEKLPEEGRNHNVALNISINCMNDSLSSVLADIGSSLNVMLKSKLSRLSFQGAPMRSSGIILKSFDEATYSCLLGRPWIHEAGAVTSILHHKLKFVKKGKLVTVYGEKTLVVSHLSSLSYLEPKEAVGTQFQALTLIDKDVKRGVSISSFKDAQRLINDGITDGWGTFLDLPENKHREGLGFSPTSKKIAEGSRFVCSIKETFHNEGFINPTLLEVSVVTKDDDSAWEPYCDDPEYDIEADDAYVPFYFPHHRKLEYIPGVGHRYCGASFTVEARVPTDPEKVKKNSSRPGDQIKEEVKKHIDAGFLVTSEYPQWLANIVPVPKKDGKVRVCVDYKDLNKASPKDDFPLPHIDMLVDSTAKFKVFSFMDGFSGYNQIKMASEDMEKTTFTTSLAYFATK
ncbi:uncharacterized protein LOC127079489 [Lathyrus oleraceus]|uniref:uncharacterized protein LOC127079489 n=1 Tax=Pisum sativum TaxID=3888 RepID=UPI0021D303AB|nr:uncharacterized protein LOC127079489 [Pisum sativum]